MTETESEAETCQCVSPDLLVYKTVRTEENKVQYLRCRACGLTAGHKKVPSTLAVRVANLEALVQELTKKFRV